MLDWLRRRVPEPRDDLLEGFYGQIVAAARQPELYRDHGVADTPLGRFEMLALHMALALRALRPHFAADYSPMTDQNPDNEAERLAQDITDRFFTDMDHAQRTLGIGDLGMRRRMTKMGQMYYGRLKSYDQALDEAAGGRNEPLRAAIARNVVPADDAIDLDTLCAYATAADRAFRGRPIAQLTGDFAVHANASLQEERGHVRDRQD